MGKADKSAGVVAPPPAQRPLPQEETHERAREGERAGERGNPHDPGPQDQPPAEVLDDENIAGDKDFELQPAKT